MVLRGSRRASGLAIALLITLSGCGGGDDEPGQPSAEPSHSPSQTAESTTTQPTTKPASCVDRTLRKLNMAERVGQLIMGGIDVSQDPATVPAELGEGHVGSLILFGNSTDGQDAIGAATDRGRAVVGSPGGVAPIVAVDQEGGQVQRFKGPGFSEIPSAEEQDTMTAADLRDAAETWGGELRSAGINLDLAPVADVVPEEIGDANEPIGELDRGYGSDAASVGEHVAAFVQGMAAAEVATAVKHFPGLGKVEGNTDFSTDVRDTLTTRDDPDLAPFKTGTDAGARFVMIGSATYEKIDPDNRAAFSSTVINGMVRDDLGFDGVVISDDLGAAEAVKDLTPAERALGFLQTGGDIVLTVEAVAVPEMTQAVADEASSDPAFQKRVNQSARRVLAVKDEMGLLSCSG